MCSPGKDSQLYVPESGKMKPNVLNQVVDIFRGTKDYGDEQVIETEKPLAFSHISEDDYFSLKEELESYEASGLLAQN